MKKRNRFISFILAIVMVLSLTFLAGCSNGNSKDVVVTINDEKVYLTEAMYYIYMVEMNYGMIITEEYWETEVEDGSTFSDLTKEYVMESLIEMQILSMEGKEAGFDLPVDGETQMKASAVEFYNALPDEVVEITGLTEKILYEINKKSYIATGQQTSIVSSLEIDVEEILDEFDREELKQYDTQFLHIPFVTTDEEKNEITLTDSQKAEAKENLEDALKEIQDGKTLKEVSEENEDLILSTASFVDNEEHADMFGVNEDYIEAAMKLDDGDVSEKVIETEDGYYIIRMLSNNSDAYYNYLVDNAFAEKQQEGYNKKIEELKEDYTITINEEVWESIELGKTTINLEAADSTDPAKENEDSTGSNEDDEDDEKAEETND